MPTLNHSDSDSDTDLRVRQNCKLNSPEEFDSEPYIFADQSIANYQKACVKLSASLNNTTVVAPGGTSNIKESSNSTSYNQNLDNFDLVGVSSESRGGTPLTTTKSLNTNKVLPPIEKKSNKTANQTKSESNLNLNSSSSTNPFTDSFFASYDSDKKNNNNNFTMPETQNSTVGGLPPPIPSSKAQAKAKASSDAVSANIASLYGVTNSTTGSGNQSSQTGNFNNATVTGTHNINQTESVTQYYEGPPNQHHQIVSTLLPSIQRCLQSPVESVFKSALENILKLYKMFGPIDTLPTVKLLVDAMRKGEEKIVLTNTSSTTTVNRTVTNTLLKKRWDDFRVTLAVVSKDKKSARQCLLEVGGERVRKMMEKENNSLSIMPERIREEGEEEEDEDDVDMNNSDVAAVTSVNAKIQNPESKSSNGTVNDTKSGAGKSFGSGSGGLSGGGFKGILGLTKKE